MAKQFSDAAKKQIHDEILPGFPNKRSALLTTLWVAEKEFGTIDKEAIDCVATELELAPAHVYGVYSFYTLFRQEGQGRFILDVCATLSCALRGARDIVHHLEDTLGIKPGETTADGMFTLRKVECLADCDHAPVMMVGEEFHRDMTAEKVDSLLSDLKAKA